MIAARSSPLAVIVLVMCMCRLEGRRYSFDDYASSLVGNVMIERLDTGR